jgi:hypothetical protein
MDRKDELVKNWIIKAQHDLLAAQKLSSDSDRYRSFIIDALQDIIDRSQVGEIRTVPVFDDAHNQYQILDIGWNESGKRVFQPMMHLELLNSKIWIQEN